LTKIGGGKKLPLSGFTSFLSPSDTFRNFAIGNIVGASGRNRVDAKNLKNYLLPIPDPESLKVFETKISSLFKKQKVNIKLNQQLSSLRD
jgi:hypothetical protein